MRSILTKQGGYQLKSLPIWRGVTNQFDEYEVRKFSLTCDARGGISQPYWDEVYQKNTQYEAEDYTFITTPPGCSTIATMRTTKYTHFIHTCIQQFSDCTIPLRVLEVGAGNLNTARVLRTLVAIEKYLVVDPAINKDQDPDVQVIRSYYNEGFELLETFDVLVSINCLEHVPDPLAFLKKMEMNLCKNHGIAILFFPDSEKQLLNGDMNALVHEHLSYFTEKNFRQLCDQVGFEVLFLESAQDCFRCVLKIGRERSVFSENALDAYKAESLVLLEKFSSRVDENFTCFKRRIEQLRDADETMIFHGATNGLNSLFYFLKQAEVAVPLEKIILVDGDETKLGKFIPSLNVPIQLPLLSLPDNAKQIIISAPSFFNEIASFYSQKKAIDGHNLVNILNLV